MRRERNGDIRRHLRRYRIGETLPDWDGDARKQTWLLIGNIRRTGILSCINDA
jgi:hypothetical protein